MHTTEETTKMMGSTKRRLARGLLLGASALTVLVLGGCKGGSAQAQQAPPPAVPVKVVTVAPESVTLTDEIPGRTSPHRMAEVRARVDGIVLERAFEEGSDVKAGQVLYRIDARPFQAALASAQANLSRAQATLESSRLLEARYKKLISERAVSQQEYDNAVAAAKSSGADVAAARAAVQTAKINLGYTTVTAPIAGRIGRSNITEGGFVRMAEATLMTTIQQLDPIYVDVTRTTAEVLRLQGELAEGHLEGSGDGARVSLKLEDGSTYAHEGKLQFSDVTVTPSTGSITLRAIFPNTERKLLPGMFVRAKLEKGTQPNALLIPQNALSRNAQGKASVMVVGPSNQVELRPVTAPRSVGNRWLISEGLAPGDRVVVEGLQKIRPGSTVAPTDVTPAPQASR